MNKRSLRIAAIVCFEFGRIEHVSLEVCHVGHSLARFKRWISGNAKAVNVYYLWKYRVSCVLCDCHRMLWAMQAYCVIGLLCHRVINRTQNISDLVSVDLCSCIDIDFFGLTECLVRHHIAIILTL